MAEIAREELKSLLENHDMDHMGHMEYHHDVEDYEADMFKGHLYTMAKQAHELNEIVSENEDIEEWVQEKIAVAANALDTVYDYLMYQKSKHEEEYEVAVDMPVGGEQDYYYEEE